MAVLRRIFESSKIPEIFFCGECSFLWGGTHFDITLKGAFSEFASLRECLTEIGKVRSRQQPHLDSEKGELLQCRQSCHSLIADIPAALQVQTLQGLQLGQGCQTLVADACAVLQRDADKMGHLLPHCKTLSCEGSFQSEGCSKEV